MAPSSRQGFARTRRGIIQLVLASALALLPSTIPAAHAAADAPTSTEATLWTIFSTECNPYFDWQSLGLLYSFRKVNQNGGFTRLMACNKSPPPGVYVVPDTHVHPNYAVHPRTKDAYSPYNKPFSIMHWLEYAKPTADYIIVLDADMVFRKAFTAVMLGVEKGRPISAHYGYLIGIFKDNFMKIKERVPNVEKAQQVGGFSVMHIEDLEQVAPRWLYWTEEVRQDPESWSNTGDIFNANGKAGPPWISEMYGYVFACAEVGVDFKVSNNVMLYPGYQPPAEPWPAVLHYGITYNVDDYAFDKHWYMGSDFTTCPGRIFNKPMRPEELVNKPGSMEYRRKTVALTVASSLYEATKWWSGHHCNRTLPDPQKQSYSCSTMSNGVVSCLEVKDTNAHSELLQRLRGAGLEEDTREVCKEDNNKCCDWAAGGECDKNPSYMLDSCQMSCNLCGGGCREGCCPMKQGNNEEKMAKEEAGKDERRRSEVTLTSPYAALLELESSVGVANVDKEVAMHEQAATGFEARAEADRTIDREVQRIEKRVTAGEAARVPSVSTTKDEEGDSEEDDEEEDYEHNALWFLELRGNTLLAFGTGTLFTLFLLSVVPSSRRRLGIGERVREKEKGSQ
mmetsp:Transcript_28895/g.71319  ORF Transcript_28895/g.71319 Transcript_28895/m.71319 type:complete len:623 (-) Transcript_28895:667-2535(-)|eukprot:CAMPEP_0197581064 /NCGR_PEP_ID=MMETSP1326-20131121/4699_1 /TAXON_ID=1155430 /ORGANISM="Genus nov. species nov., Strain RCC2288" /LENGTH=622 /DNA_ID=CAMNT_0043144917 /DNA_START=215 /DNA_END=2083 /DNA_ORIENTATION=+